MRSLFELYTAGGWSEKALGTKKTNSVSNEKQAEMREAQNNEKLMNNQKRRDLWNAEHK